jgi:hypothetical protein
MKVQFGRKLAMAAAVMALLVGLSARALAQAPAAKIDLTGAWIFTVSVDGAVSGTPTVTFKQEGEKITGHYSSQTFGENDFTGTLKGMDLVFTFGSDAAGQVTYTGKVENNESIKGTADFGGAASGTFEAARKKP